MVVTCTLYVGQHQLECAQLTIRVRELTQQVCQSEEKEGVVSARLAELREGEERALGQLEELRESEGRARSQMAELEKELATLRKQSEKK